MMIASSAQRIGTHDARLNQRSPPENRNARIAREPFLRPKRGETIGAAIAIASCPPKWGHD
jgi:hypothetical protein